MLYTGSAIEACDAVVLVKTKIGFIVTDFRYYAQPDNDSASLRLLDAIPQRKVAFDEAVNVSHRPP
jgi:hypothetical protein